MEPNELEVQRRPRAAKASAKPVVVERVYVSPLYGAMHHPFLNIRIDGPTYLPEMDSWTQLQLSSGKLKLEA